MLRTFVSCFICFVRTFVLGRYLRRYLRSYLVPLLLNPRRGARNSEQAITYEGTFEGILFTLLLTLVLFTYLVRRYELTKVITLFHKLKASFIKYCVVPSSQKLILFAHRRTNTHTCPLSAALLERGATFDSFFNIHGQLTRSLTKLSSRFLIQPLAIEQSRLLRGQTMRRISGP